MTDFMPGDPFARTSLFPRNTKLPVTVWVSVDGRMMPDDETTRAWVEVNREVLLAHSRGEIDGAEMAQMVKRVTQR